MTAPTPDVERVARAAYVVEARACDLRLTWDELSQTEQEERCTAMAAGIATLLPPSHEVAEAAARAMWESRAAADDGPTWDDLKVMARDGEVSAGELLGRYLQQARACIRGAIEKALGR